MKIRVTVIALFVSIIIGLSACSTQPNVSEIKMRFKDYSTDDNVVAVMDSCVFYFADHTLDLRDILIEETPNNGYFFINGTLYFSAVRENGIFDFSLFIYACDFYGNNKQLLFEKHGYKTCPEAVANDGIFYFEHYNTHVFDQKMRVIDSYNIYTGNYNTVKTGETQSLSDYKKNYKKNFSIDSDNEILIITDLQGGLKYTINTKELPLTALNDTLEGIDYSFSDFYITADNKIFLLYSINSNNPAYPFFICEYIPNSDDTAFKFLFFANDIMSFQVESLG